jgi:hypothetical protein
MFQHRIELEFMAWPCFMRSDRPADRIIGEVIISILLGSGGGRHCKWQHEFATLAGVVEKRNSTHMR